MIVKSQNMLYGSNLRIVSWKYKNLQQIHDRNGLLNAGRKQMSVYILFLYFSYLIALNRKIPAQMNIFTKFVDYECFIILIEKTYAQTLHMCTHTFAHTSQQYTPAYICLYIHARVCVRIHIIVIVVI